MRFLATVTKENSAYVAQCLDVDVASEGDTGDEALTNLKEALELYFEDNPSPVVVAPVIATVEVKVA